MSSTREGSWSVGPAGALFGIFTEQKGRRTATWYAIVRVGSTVTHHRLRADQHDRDGAMAEARALARKLGVIDLTGAA